LTPVDRPDKDHVSRALSMARTSTASLGKFDESLPKEKPERRRGKKRKVCKTFTLTSVQLIENASRLENYIKSYIYIATLKTQFSESLPACRYVRASSQVFRHSSCF